MFSTCLPECLGPLDWRVTSFEQDESMIVTLWVILWLEVLRSYPSLYGWLHGASGFSESSCHHKGIPRQKNLTA